jgi:uncharacterized membrane protein
VAAAVDNYIPLEIAANFRAQAWRTWGVGLTIAGLWLALILAAPIAKANGLVGVSSPLYTFFGYLCHQLDGRSFHVEGEKFAVCSRCFGVYAGIVIAFIAYPFWRRIESIEPLPKFWLFAACIPAAIDWSLTVFGIWENTYLSRAVTGGLLGFACGTFIVPSIVEIGRNLALRRGTFGSRAA